VEGSPAAKNKNKPSQESRFRSRQKNEVLFALIRLIIIRLGSSGGPRISMKPWTVERIGFVPSSDPRAVSRRNQTMGRTSSHSSSVMMSTMLLRSVSNHTQAELVPARRPVRAKEKKINKTISQILYSTVSSTICTYIKPLLYSTYSIVIVHDCPKNPTEGCGCGGWCWPLPLPWRWIRLECSASRCAPGYGQTTTPLVGFVSDLPACLLFLAPSVSSWCFFSCPNLHHKHLFAQPDFKGSWGLLAQARYRDSVTSAMACGLV